MKRDDSYKAFLTGEWDPSQANYGFFAEEAGLQR